MKKNKKKKEQCFVTIPICPKCGGNKFIHTTHIDTDWDTDGRVIGYFAGDCAKCKTSYTYEEFYIRVGYRNFEPDTSDGLDD